MSGVALVGYFTVFGALAVGLVFGALLLGKLFRPDNPTPIKKETYECGEPSVGSADIQFDIRFYVMALVFLIFDVEVALFFPWATVFGKATHVASISVDSASRRERLAELGITEATLPPLSGPKRPATLSNGISVGQQAAGPTGLPPVEELSAWGRRLATLALCDILVFFGVLMVGFAYVWCRGDLTWVRAVPHRA
ncbi:MAG TPA: NADH-quinone oxidoreductase subunit A [Thermogutta sp.]|nr:NADH-quinone oxidoreductase subunit A [Thermogutta sp.]